MVQPIKVPDIGEKVESGVVVVVHIKVGDTVVVDDTVIELETDKALVEIPSPFAGRITDVLAKVGAHMKVGDTIARIEIEAADPSTGLKPSVADGDGRMNEPEGGEAEAASDAKDQPQPDPSDIPITRTMVPASPSIRRLAWELGIDLYSVDGSGPGGRISEADVKGPWSSTADGCIEAGAMLFPFRCEPLGRR